MSLLMNFVQFFSLCIDHKKCKITKKDYNLISLRGGLEKTLLRNNGLNLKFWPVTDR